MASKWNTIHLLQVKKEKTMANIKAEDGKKLRISNRSAPFRTALRGNVQVGDIVEGETGDLTVVALFDGKDLEAFYEEKLSETPSITYRKNIVQLSAQFGTDPKKGGALLKKNGSNAFVFVPFDASKDK